jgi:sugar-specific transcriptional regulator TrmB
METEPLKELGLSDKEIIVYLAGLEIGLSSVSGYSDKSNLARTTTYDLLKSLKEKGLASYVIRSGVKYFSVANPEELLNQIQEKEKKIKLILPDLKAHQQNRFEKPKVEFYQGPEGMRTVALDVMKESQIKFYDSFVSAKTLSFLPFFHEQFRRKRKENKLFVKMISEKTELTNEMKKNDKKELRETRFYDNLMKDLPVSLFVYGNKIAFIIWSEKEQMGIIIEHKDIAELQRRLFKDIWKISKK